MEMSPLGQILAGSPLESDFGIWLARQLAIEGLIMEMNPNGPLGPSHTESTFITARFGDMLGSFPLSNRCPISLDFGHISGVPFFEALPNGWLDIPIHFMKGRNDPCGSGLVVTLGDFVRLVCNHLH